MTYLGATFGRYSSSRVATPNMLVVTWDENLLYPSTGTIQNTIFRPTVVLPASNWQYATALPGGRRDGNAVTFDDVSLEHLVDAPLDAGTNYRRWLLWRNGDASAYSERVRGHAATTGSSRFDHRALSQLAAKCWRCTARGIGAIITFC